MRVIVMFDMPSISSSDKREYRCFRKFLIKSGFVMIQESVYSKLALNATAGDAIIANVKKNKPDRGLVQMLVITEKQYAKMDFVVGISKSEVITSDERLVIL